MGRWMSVFYLFVYSAVPCLGSYHRLTNNRVSINHRVPFKRRVQVYILVNNRRFQINAGSDFLLFVLIKEEDMTTDTAHFSSLPFSRLVLAFCQSISIITIINNILMIAMAPVSLKNKKYNLKFKISVRKTREKQPLDISLSTPRA